MSVIENACADALRHATFAIPASPESVGLARKMTVDVLQAWTSPVDDYLTTVALSEVFTNALQHGVDAQFAATTRIGVDLVETETGLHVEVHDPNQAGDGNLAAGQAAADSESGRGLELVEAIAASWGYKHTSTGKLVFFDMVAPAFGQGAEASECVQGSAARVVVSSNRREQDSPSRVGVVK